MILYSLLLIPFLGIFTISVYKDKVSSINIKFIALIASVLNLLISLILFIFFNFSTNQFQYVQESYEISYYNIYLGVDGLSVYFILLTTIIVPVSLLSNWVSIFNDIKWYFLIILFLEILLLSIFFLLDILLFYTFFESILPPLFILIGIFGSDNKVKASFYLFLYTLLGSLFLLLSILDMSSIVNLTDYDSLFKVNYIYLTQLFLFCGIFIAFAVKTPTIFLNTWLLKAHVESPLGGSIILAAIVLKLSLYGIFRLILPILPKAYLEYTFVIYMIGIITIFYASLSTLRTIDVKELIAYSSVSHAAVYLLAVFSNSIQGIEGSISLGLAHGLVSPALFICAGGILYDRSHSRIISNYKGVVQVMPLFAILFFIFCLANCGAPLTLNFVGEFMSLYGVFERSSILGVLASSSIVFSAGYTIYMYQRISFGGSYSKLFMENIPDLTWREFIILFTLVIPTVVFGIYVSPILDAIHYSVSTLIYNVDFNVLCHSPDSEPGSEEFKKMAACKDPVWSLVQPLKFIRNQVPLCDFFKPGQSYNDVIVYHEVFSFKLESYYMCTKCPAHICANCHNLWKSTSTSQSYLFLVISCIFNKNYVLNNFINNILYKIKYFKLLSKAIYFQNPVLFIHITISICSFIFNIILTCYSDIINVDFENFFCYFLFNFLNNYTIEYTADYSFVFCTEDTDYSWVGMYDPVRNTVIHGGSASHGNGNPGGGDPGGKNPGGGDPGGKNPGGGNPGGGDPGGGSNSQNHRYMTDEAADFYSDPDFRNRYLNVTGVKFIRTERMDAPEEIKRMSLITQEIRRFRPDLFVYRRPGQTEITPHFINTIRNMRMDFNLPRTN
jgi:NADH-ubiquinone oxidoreductase chain 4